MVSRAATRESRAAIREGSPVIEGVGVQMKGVGTGQMKALRLTMTPDIYCPTSTITIDARNH